MLTPGDPAFGEGDELGLILRGLFNEFACLLDTGRQIEPCRLGLGDGDTYVAAGHFIWLWDC